MDAFYNVLTPEQKEAAANSNHNFDHPDAFDFDLLLETLRNLKEGKSVEIPQYDFVTHSRLPKTTTLYGANVIIFEGIFALYDKRIVDLMDIKQYQKFVKPSFEEFIKPTMKNADVIIPRGLENLVAIDLITKHIQGQLQELRFNFRWDLTKIECGKELPKNVIILEQKPQLRGIQTIIRDRNTQRDDFIFYAERLATLVVERGLAELAFDEHRITTPLNLPYVGKKFDGQLCAVSVVRAGGTMETGFRRAVKDATIGKILIQTNPKTGEPSTAAAVAAQSGVVKKNLLHAIIEGPNSSDVAKYDGYASCPLVVGQDKVVLAEFSGYTTKPMETFPFDQGKESSSMYFLTKEILPEIYWNRLLKGTWEGPHQFR
ncbi:4624_t:CDS:10, partial [Acaulospora colombiana]